MKSFVACLLMVAVSVSAPVHAQSTMPSPLIGRWTVDISRLPMPATARPKSVTIGFGDAGEGKWTMDVDIIDAGGKEIHSTGKAALDGSPIHVQGSPEADTAAMKLPVAGTLVVALGKQGVPASTRIYAAAADGNSMVETAVYFGRDGLPIMRTNYFTRIR